MASAMGNRVSVVVEVFTVASGSLVFLRLFTRLFLMRNAGLGDVCIAFAMICGVALTVAISEQTQFGMGWHFDSLTPQMQVDFRKAFWASIWIYNLALTFTKISILIQYTRIFPRLWFRQLCYAALVVVTLWGLWTFFGSIFLCFPVSFFWDKSTKDGKCLNQLLVYLLNAGVNITQDFVILLLPMPLLRKLNLPKGQKAALVAVFALGGSVIIVSTVRLRTLVKIANSTDPSIDNAPTATLSAIEVHLGIVCACLPYLRPIATAMLPSWFPEPPRPSSRQQIDEEQPKTFRSFSSRTRSYSAISGSRVGHSRNGSTSSYSQIGSELSNLKSPEPAVFGTGTRVHGHARPVIVNHSRSGSAATAPRLPRLPEDLAVITPKHNGSLDRLFRSSVWPEPLSPRRKPRTPVFQKPLPITPFPVAGLP